MRCTIEILRVFSMRNIQVIFEIEELPHISHSKSLFPLSSIHCHFARYLPHRIWAKSHKRFDCVLCEESKSEDFCVHILIEIFIGSLAFTLWLSSDSLLRLLFAAMFYIFGFWNLWMDFWHFLDIPEILIWTSFFYFNKRYIRWVLQLHFWMW